MVGLTPRDIEVIAAAFQCIKGNATVDIDYDKLAIKAGYKNGQSAAVCFREIKKKMLVVSGDVTATSKKAPAKKNTTAKKRVAPTSGSEDEEEVTTKKQAKAKKSRTTKKNVKAEPESEDDEDDVAPGAAATAIKGEDADEEDWPTQMNVDEGEDEGATAEELIKKESGVVDEDDEV